MTEPENQPTTKSTEDTTMANDTDKHEGGSGIDYADWLDTERKKTKDLTEGFDSFVKAGCPDGATAQLRQELKEQEELSSRLLQRCFDAESDLRGTKASVVHELELAGVTRTYDDEEIHCGNYLQGIRILRDRANLSNNKD
jgi:hypothetical protein